LVRVNDQVDKRKYYFYLTEAGRLVMEAAFRIVVDNASKKYAHLSDEEQQELMVHMRVIMNKLFM
jgi:DNA-binding MarR family transcriptional regulator